MSERTIDSEFPQGLLRAELFVGVVCAVNASDVSVHLAEARQPSASHYAGGRYGRGEVGEFVLIEGQLGLLLGRIAEVRLLEGRPSSSARDLPVKRDPQTSGSVKLLGQVAMDDLTVTAGVGNYPRLGDRVYAAHHKFLAMLPQLMERAKKGTDVTLHIGNIENGSQSEVKLTPERLFGRHCAILGATGGGKSWTTARVIEECLKYDSKLILLDATGEYRSFTDEDLVLHCHLGEPLVPASGSIETSLPPYSFQESDLLALFEPAGRVQGPKMKAAMRSLKLAAIRPTLATDGFIIKAEQPTAEIFAAERDPTIAQRLDDPAQAFDIKKLAQQIVHECVYPSNGARWGKVDDAGISFCVSLISRINGVLASPAFRCVFQRSECPPITVILDEFASLPESLLRICLSGIAYEYQAREIIANVIGRHLLLMAREGKFRNCPTVVLVDEAHNFLGRRIGSEDYMAKLDAFELIAKEGRKYGLNVCLASQRPRDITEGVLSQMGTLIVHRLTNDHDREVVERACGEIYRGASAFLPNLRPGEAAIIGTDFPIPLTLTIQAPATKPISDGPKYQEHWRSDEKEAGQAAVAAPEKAMTAGD